MKKRLPVLHFFGEITRRDDAERTVEGYVFVNEDAGDGFRIRRSAMEAASDEYFRNLREMHNPQTAVGTATDIVWDAKGCLCRFKIVDDAAWAKVVEGVYRGFSVGVRPLIARGSKPVDVTQVDWVETSLVDRPRDKDALILHRVDGAPEWDAEVDVDIEIDEPVMRGLFADAVQARMPYRQLDFAFELLRDVVCEISCTAPENAESLIRKAAAEFAEFVTPLVGRVEAGEIERRAPDPAPAAAMPVPNEVMERLAAIEGAVQRWVDRPDPTQARPMLVTAKGLVERMAVPTLTQEREQIQQEIDEILARSYDSDAARDAAFLKVSALKARLG